MDLNPNNEQFDSYDLASNDEAEIAAEAARKEGAVLHGIPPVPLHLCPTCRYNLTGLTEFRCPECGNAFTLATARTTGSGEDGSDYEADLRVLRKERVLFNVHCGMLILSFLVPTSLALIIGSSMSARNTIGVMVLLLLLPTIVTTYLSTMLSWEPSTRLFVIAWLAAGLSALVSLLIAF